MVNCKCGSKMVCVDGHYICESYFEDIKKMMEEMKNEIQARDEEQY